MGFNADIKRSLTDCIFFGERYFPHLLTEKCAPFHYCLIDIAEDREHERISILAPRGHAKSTWLSIIYPIWKIVQNRDIKIIIVSDTIEQAELFFEAIKEELEANERLIEDFGTFAQPTQRGAVNRWQSNRITVSRPTRSKEPTLFCAGTRKRIVGKRADLIIVDDPLNDENTENTRQRRKTLRWFMKTLTPIANPDTGRIIVIGTRKHPEDLHAELSRNPRYIQHIFKALGGDSHDTPLWPERWPRERLLREKSEIGSLIFAQEYQNEPVSEENALFRREWIEQCYSYTTTLGGLYRGSWPVFTGWDLSVVADRIHAEEHNTDFTVGITIALGEDGTRHILDIYRERGLTPAQVLDTIRAKARQYQPALITLENNLFQALYEHQLVSSTDLPIAGHTTGREKMDLYKGVPSLSVLFEHSKYRIPCGDERSARLAAALTDELAGLGYEAHDDMVMALWIAECGIRMKSHEATRVEIIDDPTW